MARVDSPRNPRVQAVRRLATTAGRREQGRFVVESPGPVRAALRAGRLIELYSLPDDPTGLATGAREQGVAVTEVSARVLEAMAGTVHPQGVVGVAAVAAARLEDLVGAPRLVLLLDRVGDPGNAGTAIRTADAAGADAVVLTDGSVDPHNPKCVRASAGSLFHLPVVAGAGLPTAVAHLRSLGLQVLATSGSVPGAAGLDELEDSGRLAAPTAWLLGSEAHGLDGPARDLADATVRIPMRGAAESLNLGAAAAVCLYASARAQRGHGAVPAP